MLYLTSVHWAFAHLLLGEIDVTPTKAAERAYSILIHSVGLIVFSSFVSSLTELMAHAAEQSAEKSRRDSEVRDYMEDHLVCVRLTSCIEHYRRHARHHAHRQKLPREDIDGLENLPEALAVKLSEEVYMRKLKAHGFFSVFQRLWSDHIGEIIHQVVGEKYFAPDEEIFLAGQSTECVYIVAKGQVWYTKDSLTVDANDGAWVSEPALWLGDWNRRGDLASRSHVELFRMDIGEFRVLVVENFSTGLFACQFAELVARGVHQGKIPFTSLSDLELDLQGRGDYAERAVTW